MTNKSNNNNCFYLSIIMYIPIFFFGISYNKNVDNIVKLTVVLIIFGVLMLGCILLIS